MSPDNYDSDRISIPLGIIIGLIASFIQSLGLTIQRKSHVLNQSLPENNQRIEHRRPLWLLGFSIFISSNIIGSLVQIASLPVVILAPLGAVSLLWNAFFARLLLGDVFSPWMALGTILIAGGAILIGFFGIVSEQTRSLEDLLALFRRPTFIAYFSILGFVVLICLCITHFGEFSLSRRLKKLLPLESSETENLPAQPSNLICLLPDMNIPHPVNERTPLLDPKSGTMSPSNDPKYSHHSSSSVGRTRLILAISYASFSGIISGMCLLFAKSGVELLLLTVTGHNQFWRWEAWLLIFGLIIFAILQLWYLHKALVLADPTLVCPSAFCFYNLSSIANGLIYFNQFSLIPPLHIGLVALGILVLLAGVWVVSIHSGGGGVGIGTWNEEAVLLDANDSDVYSDLGEQGDDSRSVPQQPVKVDSEPRSHFKPIVMERESLSESSLPNLSTSPLDLPSSSSGARPRAEFQLYDSRRTPSSLHVSFSRARQSSPTQAQLRTFSFPHPPHPHVPLAPSLGAVSTLGAGFQIGLSPLSPGFTIVPIDRKRRTSAIGGVVANEAIRERRRTVSEGEVSWRLRGGIEPRGNENEIEDGREEHTDANVNRDRERWRWLKRVFFTKV